MFLKNIFLLLILFKNYYCDYKTLSRNIWPYYSYNKIGPFWNYPVDIETTFNGRLFKRDAPITEQDYLYNVNVATRPDYKNAGSWAKGKTPVKEVAIDWMPLQIYSQVRRTNSEKHLPQESANQDAITSEELINAPRLKEVVSHKKIQQVYEEEGFEDSGYDHGGYNHQGANYADISKKEAAELIKDEKPSEHKENPSESNKILSISNETISRYPKAKVNHDTEDNYQEARIINIGDNPPFHLRTKFINKFNSEEPKKLYTNSDERNNFRTRVEPVKKNGSSVISESERINDNSSKVQSTIVFPGSTTRRNYVQHNSTPLWSSISAHRIPVSKNNKRTRFRYHPTVQAHLDNLRHYIESSDNGRFVKSSERNSGKFVDYKGEQNGTRSEELNERDQSLYGSGADTLAAYATLAKQNISSSSVQEKNERNGKINPHYNNITRIIYTRYDQGNDAATSAGLLPLATTSFNIRHPSMPSDSQELYEYEVFSVKTDPSLMSLGTRTPKVHLYTNDTSNPVKYIEQLTIAHYSSPINNKILQITPENKKNRLKDLAKALNAPQETDKRIIRLKRELNIKNYNKSEFPFYDKEHSISEDSALKYASNPSLRPDKTKGGMAFYEQKDKLVKCDDPEPPEDIIPIHDQDGEWNKKPYPENSPRIKGLGDKILCFKRRYFGENPLNNPFFQEKLTGNIKGFEPEKGIRKYSAKISVQGKSDSSNDRVMVMPESEERNSDVVPSESGIGIISNHRNIFDAGLPHRNHKPDTKSHYLNNKIPFNYQSEPNKQYSTYEVPEEETAASVKVKLKTKKKRKRPYNYIYRKKKNPKKRKRKVRPRPYPVSIYSVINGHYYPNHYKPIVYAHSNKNYRVIPVYEKNVKDSIPSDSQNSYQFKPEKYYVIRPGEYTHNKDLLKNKETNGIWNYMNPLKWWFPGLFDSRRKEPKYRAKRQLSLKYANEDDVQEIPVNHKPETTTTGKPITLEEFKRRFNITDKPKTVVQYDMITGGFFNAQSSSTTVPQETLPTIPPSLETTTRSTVGTSKKPRVHFPRTNKPKIKIYESRGDQKYSTTTTDSTSSTPNSSTRRPFLSRKLINLNRNRNKTITTTEIPTSTENNENPRRLKQVEHRRVTEEVIKTTYLPEEQSEETNSSQEQGGKTNPQNIEDEQINNGTLTYFVNPSTGNGSWEYERKKKRKPKSRQFKKTNKLKSDKETIGSESEADKDLKHVGYPTAQSGNEAYIIGLMSKVPPTDMDRKRYQRRPLQKQETSTAHVKRKNGYVPQFNTKIPLKFILQPDKRKYYYVVDT
ncbi:hypothetical protein O3M35_003239 [Rhynocoris fuscipes]|uniref:Uncharacterized protein n=1 Tax=Rhynocoris fuscipes TaxID=488301 RepID=A0AAW1CIC8_9HEMI